MPTREPNAILIARRAVHSRLLILRVAPEGWELPEFSPGQYATIGLPGSAPRVDEAGVEAKAPAAERVLLRAYSIASSSRARQYIELYVNLVDSGTFTPRLFALEPGARLYLKPGFKGVFTLEQVPADQHLVLIATGTGLAPYMSMLRSAAECGGARRFAVLLGARFVRDLGYHAELVELAATCANITYLPIVSQPEPESGWVGAQGRVQELWRGEHLTHAWGRQPAPSDTHVFLCGNPEMITEMRALLAQEGFIEHSRHEPGQVHAEIYW